MIKEICHKLSEKRKELGYDIEYAVDKTKLHPSVIRDIESGNLANINSAYTKGFMKIYASFLGVDLGNSLEEISLSTVEETTYDSFPFGHTSVRLASSY